ncbi:Hypothetical predicted protein, partial [Paramuricea clavata]
ADNKEPVLAKLLGVVLSDDLKWNCHIDYICKKAAKLSFLLRLVLIIISMLAPVTAKLKSLFRLLCDLKLLKEVSDSSKEVYSAVVYLRLIYAGAVKVVCCLVALAWIREWLKYGFLPIFDYAEVEVENSGGGKISQAGMAEVANFSNQTHKGQDNQKCSLSSVINSNRFSSLKKLILVTGYVLRFVNNLRKRVKRETNLITEYMITVTEYNEALIMWIKDEQFQLKQQDNYSKLEASLHLFEDKDGVLRLRGRFANASLQYEEQ